MAHVPTDPLYPQQWYLNNTGTNSNGGTAGIDLNIVDSIVENFDVWNDYTGKGITVGIIDDGVESTHEDLAANYNSAPAGFTYDPASGQPQGPDDSHGTAVAGIIAGVATIGETANNQVGISGVAYSAKITGFRYADITDTDASVLSNQQFFDVSNNSWGGTNPFDTDFNTPAGQLQEQAITEAATKGREGKGTVFVWAAGNEFEAGVNSNYRNYENSRYTIAVSAVDANGVFAPYSVQGANLLVSAFGDGDPSAEPSIPGTILTTDRMGDAGYNTAATAGTAGEPDSPNYTGTFNGTSSAAPMVSGVVALILQANRDLGYRDVQEILAYSAIQNDPTEDNQNDWRFNAATNWNGGGLHNNHNYGFGLVDGHAAVRMAETWTMQSTAANSTVGNKEQMVENGPATQEIKPIPDGDANGLSTTLNIESGLEIDHIEVDLNIEHTAIEELYITLLSPDGTETILFDGPALKTITISDTETVSFADFRSNPNNPQYSAELQALGASYQKGINFTFGSTFYWGETGAGDWTLKVEDRGTAGTGTLNSWGLRLFGDTISPDDTYIYTDEFGTVAGSDTLRGTLTDADGMDTINASAITTGISLDLTAGSTGNTLAGGTLAIDASTTIESAFGGDGNDTITGNDANNTIFGGRGADSLMGGAGDDTIMGGKGANTLMGGVGADVCVLTSKNGGTFIQDEDGADSLVFSDDSVTGFNPNPAADMALSMDSLTAGVMGVARQGTNLVIDLDASGTIEGANDLTIANFFTEGDSLAGAGFIETVANLSGNQLLGLVDMDETMNGGTATSTLPGGTGTETLPGGTGTSTLPGGTGTSTLPGGTGTSTLPGGTGTETLPGGTGTSTLPGGTGTETMAGGEFTIADMKMAEGNDTITEMTFTVSLAKAATEAMTVSYMTKAGTAMGISAPDAKLFTADLTGGEEVPPVESKAKGMAMVELNAAKNALDYSVTVEGLDFTTLTGGQASTPDTLDDVGGLHIHAGKMDQKGGVVFDILADLATDTLDTSATVNSDGTVTIKGKWEADDTLAGSQPLSNFTSLIGGESGSDSGLYVNVHTNANPDGEIRGQLIAKAADFVNKSGEITFAAGETQQTITVGVIGDMMVEEDETFTVSLMDAKGMEVAKAATGTIANDGDTMTGGTGTETMAGGEFTIADMKMAEGNDTITQMTFTVSLAEAATEAMTVSYMTKAGTAMGISAQDAKLFTADLTGAEEVPLVESKAKGMAMVELNAAKNALDYSVTVEGLDFTTLTGGQASTPDTLDDVGGLHIHAGAKGKNGDVVFDILQDLASDTSDTSATVNSDGTVTIKGKWEADDAAAKLPLTNFTSLMGGESGSDTGLYVNVHTNANTKGEIRGQLIAKAADFVNKSGELTFAAGETQQTITVGVIGDMMVEEDETFTVSLMDAKGMEVAKAATGTIANDDSMAAATEQADTLTGGEMGDTIDGLGGDDAIKGGAGNDIISGGAGNDMLDGGPGDDSLVGGDGNDTLMAMNGADTLDGGAGDDSLVGGSKGMLMGGAGSDTYVLDSMTGAGTMIMDSEGDADTLTLTGITLSVDDSLPAGAVGLQRQGTNLVIDINADGVFDETDLTVQNFFAAETMAGGTDSMSGGTDTMGGGTDTMAGGSDTMAAAKGTGYIEMVGNLTGETILGALTEAQPPAAMAELSIDSVSAAEGSGTLTFTVSLSEASTETVTVDYTTIDDTVQGAATEGVDYEDASGTLTFAAGLTTQTFTVSLINDADVEPDETFTVSLSGAMGAEITTAGATGTITDDDTLVGGTEGPDTLKATGDATFEGSLGSDIITGAASFFSQVSYFSLTIGVFVNLLTGFVLKGENGQSGTDTLQSIQAIEGSDQADTIVGSDSETAGENLMGNLGADSLDGGAGNDTLDGGMPENDTQVGLDSDTITAGVGDDVVMGCLGGDSIDGGEGADQLTYMKSTASVTINVTVGTVAVKGFETDNFTGIEVLEGSEFGDTLIGGGEGVSVTLKGGKGGDSLAGGAGDVTLDGGEGDDTLTGGTGKGMLEGGKGNDSLVAGVGSETLMGGKGSDTYELDTLKGGGTVIEEEEGDGDTLTGFTLKAASLSFAAGVIGVQRSDSTLQIDLNASGTFDAASDLSVLNFFAAGITGNAITKGAGYIELVGGIQGSEIVNFVASTATGGGQDTTGGGQDTTGGGQDTTGGGQDTTGGGQDTTGGGTGTDTQTGGTGTDTTGGGVVVPPPPTSTPTPSPTPSGTPSPTPTPTAGSDTLTGTDAADTLAGGAGNDALSGGAGNDTLNGEDGNDDITGGDGEDNLSGGAGNDTCAGGAGNDMLSGEEGADSLDGGDGSDSLTSGTGNDVCAGGMGNDSLSGEDGDDKVKGDDGEDEVKGGNGKDEINGNKGRDTVEGGAGNDICQGGKDDDKVRGDQGNDVVLGNDGNDEVDGGDETDFCNGSKGNDKVEGGAGNDILRGGKESDTVTGGVGGDAIMGDLGDDMLVGVDMNSATAGMGEMDALTGGAGLDMFVLGMAGKGFYEGDGISGMAVIRDFNGSEDTIQLSGSISSYSLQVEVSTSTTIVTTTDGDVIARVEGNTSFSLSASYCSFVS
ncbi:MAG: CHRD domain-containing protein [Oscillatoria princeps RMCB-10]|jgi:Ca2+-binding RTX toxin-like protein/subtilisin-like proprotein convertase family protein|nr:CHRD domain-containing protein [Oscillatoria princeps RMCB-10]